MPRALKYFLLGLLLLILLIVVLVLINPQFADNHDTPYLNLVAEREAPPPVEGDILQRVLLFGDAGSSTIDPWQASLQKMSERALISPEKTAAVALGDNIYYMGYPNKETGQKEWDESQLESIEHLDAQLKVAKVSGARFYFVPGNHDWYAGELDGMRTHITEYANEHDVAAEFRPLASDTLGAADAINLPGVSLVFVDSSALLKSDENELKAAMLTLTESFDSIRETYPDNLIVVNQHHPLETMGQHAGYMTHFAYWFFIRALDLFTEVTAEDTYHPNYIRIINALDAAMKPYENVIHAGGHDHSLQVFRRPHSHGPEYTIVSGAANTSKLSGVWHTDNSRFALSQEGFVELNVTANGTYLQVFDIDHDEPRAGFWLSF
ncbi:MAG: metallophosphoesterase [Pseudomonadales bacterium]